MITVELTNDSVDRVVVASLVESLQYCLEPEDKKHLKKTLKYYTTHDEYKKLKKEWK